MPWKQWLLKLLFLPGKRNFVVSDSLPGRTKLQSIENITKDRESSIAEKLRGRAQRGRLKLWEVRWPLQHLGSISSRVLNRMKKTSNRQLCANEENWKCGWCVLLTVLVSGRQRKKGRMELGCHWASDCSFYSFVWVFFLGETIMYLLQEFITKKLQNNNEYPCVLML